MSDRAASIIAGGGCLSLQASPPRISRRAEDILGQLAAELRSIEQIGSLGGRAAALAILEALEAKRGRLQLSEAISAPLEPASGLPLAAYAYADFAALLISKLQSDEALLTRALHVAVLMRQPTSVDADPDLLGMSTWNELATAASRSDYNPDLLVALRGWVEHVVGLNGVAKAIAESQLLGRWPACLLSCLMGEKGSPEGAPSACRMFELVCAETDASQHGFQVPLDALCSGVRLWHRRARCSLQPPPVVHACIAAAEACVRTVAAMALRRRSRGEPLRGVVPALLRLLDHLLDVGAAVAEVPCAEKRRADDDCERISSTVVPCTVCTDDTGPQSAGKATSASATRPLTVSWGAPQSAAASAATAAERPAAAAAERPAAAAVAAGDSDSERYKPISELTGKLCGRICLALLLLFASAGGACMQQQAVRCGAEALFARLLVSGDDGASLAASKALSFLFALERRPFAFLLDHEHELSASIDRLIQLLCNPACSLSEAECHAALLVTLLSLSPEQRARIADDAAGGSEVAAGAAARICLAEQLVAAVGRFAAAPEFNASSDGLHPYNFVTAVNVWGGSLRASCCAAFGLPTSLHRLPLLSPKHRLLAAA